MHRATAARELVQFGVEHRHPLGPQHRVQPGGMLPARSPGHRPAPAGCRTSPSPPIGRPQDRGSAARPETARTPRPAHRCSATARRGVAMQNNTSRCRKCSAKGTMLHLPALLGEKPAKLRGPCRIGAHAGMADHQQPRPHDMNIPALDGPGRAIFVKPAMLAHETPAARHIPRAAAALRACVSTGPQGVVCEESRV